MLINNELEWKKICNFDDFQVITKNKQFNGLKIFFKLFSFKKIAFY